MEKCSHVSIDEKIAGIIIFGDKMRSGADLMIKRLGNLGITKTVMLTGDSFENANLIKKQAGITHLEANLLPEQKVNAIKRLRENMILL